MELGVAVTVVPTQGEADVLSGLLATEGIEAKARELLADGASGALHGWHEIMVRRSDVDRARELIEAAKQDRQGGFGTSRCQARGHGSPETD